MKVPGFVRADQHILRVAYLPDVFRQSLLEFVHTRPEVNVLDKPGYVVFKRLLFLDHQRAFPTLEAVLFIVSAFNLIYRRRGCLLLFHLCGGKRRLSFSSTKVKRQQKSVVRSSRLGDSFSARQSGLVLVCFF